MKSCSKCNLKKSLNDFYIRKTGLRAGEYYEKCSECYKNRGRNYYRQNRERQLSLAKLRKKKYVLERKIWLEKIKKKPCADCGKIYPPWVMDFDHTDGHIKIGTISFLAFKNTATFETIKKEIGKCDLVCANCHRQRTHDRLVKLAEVANVVKAPL